MDAPKSFDSEPPARQQPVSGRCLVSNLRLGWRRVDASRAPLVCTSFLCTFPNPHRFAQMPTSDLSSLVLPSSVAVFMVIVATRHVSIGLVRSRTFLSTFGFDWTPHRVRNRPGSVSTPDPLSQWTARRIERRTGWVWSHLLVRSNPSDPGTHPGSIRHSFEEDDDGHDHVAHLDVHSPNTANLSEERLGSECFGRKRCDVSWMRSPRWSNVGLQRKREGDGWTGIHTRIWLVAHQSIPTVLGIRQGGKCLSKTRTELGRGRVR